MIRDATLADLPVLLAMGELMHDESPRFSRLRFDAARLEETLRGVIGQPHGFVMVAEHEGQGVTGGMVAALVQHWASLDAIAVDLALYVVPEFRGGLTPLRLVNAYRRWAKRAGAVWAQVGVSTGVDDGRVTDLLERVGFTRCGAILEADHV